MKLIKFIILLFIIIIVMISCKKKEEPPVKVKMVDYYSDSKDNSQNRVQSRTRREYENKKFIRSLKEDLELTDEQFNSVKEILEDENKRRTELMPKHEGKRPNQDEFKKMREQMSLLEQETNEKLKTVLSEEQLNEYNKIKEEKRKKQREHRDPHR